MTKRHLERDDFSSNRHPAPAYWWSMIFFRKPVSTFRDHALMTMAAILIVLGSVVAIKSFISATFATAPQAATIPTYPTAISEPAIMKIVPAPVIDPKSEVFIGTGDR